MKRIAMMLVAGSVLFGAGLAQADDDWHPRCRIHEIEEHMNRAIGEIKQSPAMGHAGGHYGRAIEDLEKVKRQLREGCHAWMKDHRD
jgi:hypothetical protein